MARNTQGKQREVHTQGLRHGDRGRHRQTQLNVCVMARNIPGNAAIVVAHSAHRAGKTDAKMQGETETVMETEKGDRGIVRCVVACPFFADLVARAENRTVV
jgi:hypothetical protein